MDEGAEDEDWSEVDEGVAEDHEVGGVESGVGGGDVESGEWEGLISTDDEGGEAGWLGNRLARGFGNRRRPAKSSAQQAEVWVD